MFEEGLKEIEFAHEIKKSFLDYAMSVIVQRALPDVRDGLKPVQRRIIYGMNELGAIASSPYKKCARISGDIMGKYHPHGDSSIYDALVRMAQDFNYRYLLVDGHGNFGSIDGDGAAASRYTEARMSKLSMELIRDINKETVDFQPNYDGEELEPVVLPARFPNLLVNGSTGIAVGMATNIPPHNLGEVIDGCIALLKNPEITLNELMQYIKGPDFPTGATILGNKEIIRAYETGKGSITIRSKAHIEEMKNGKSQIIVTEIPYVVNKANLVESIANLVKNKVIDGITDLRDESSMKGIRIVIELRKDINANVMLNNLYKHTQLQYNFGINTLALVDNEPRVLSLKELLSYYLDHQKIVIVRRTQYDLDKAEKRVHILEGLKIALDNIDEIVQLIKKSKTDQESIDKLMNNYALTEIQAKAILEMKLRRLTGLERDKLEEELNDLLLQIADFKDILAKPERISNIIEQELTEIKNKYSDERRTEIDLTAVDYIENEELIPEEEVMITLTNKGYIKRINIDTYKIQNRGGVGIKGVTTIEDDYIEKIITMNSHDYLLLFSDYGKVYRLKGYEIPEFSRQAKGLPIINLLPIEKEEKITSLIAGEEEEKENKFLVFFTKKGIIKKTNLEEFAHIQSKGKIAINLKEEDSLISVCLSGGNNLIVIGADNGKIAKFKESDIRSIGRNAAGVKGMNLGKDDNVIGGAVTGENDELLIIAENGYGKRTDVSEFRLIKRGGKGVKALNTTNKTGRLVAIRALNEEDDELIIATDEGMIIKIQLETLSKIGRNTQGVKLINLKSEQKIAAISIINSKGEDLPE